MKQREVIHWEESTTEDIYIRFIWLCSGAIVSTIYMLPLEEVIRKYGFEYHIYYIYAGDILLNITFSPNDKDEGTNVIK